MGDLTKLDLSYVPEEDTIMARYLTAFGMDTEGDVTGAITKIARFWRDNCGGKRVFLVVDYANLGISLAVNDFFRREIETKLLDKFIIAIVRFGGSAQARTAARTRAIKGHIPSHLYANLEEAKAVVSELREGHRLSIEPGPTSRGS
jgi:hypothetical protein